MTAHDKDRALSARLNFAGIPASTEQARTLRRAEKTLHRWAELECGNGNDYASWSIERDEETGLPYLCRYPHTGKMSRTKVADREAGALKRIAATCKALGAHFFHQGDPRGCALYVSMDVLTDSDYNRGVHCSEG